METTITLTTNDLLTVDQFAQYTGRPRITIYKWIDRGKLKSITLGKTLYIPTYELTIDRVARKCSNCYHEKHEDGTRTCACRELSNMEDGCKDWVWKWN
jgi:excisionase family DNA binding protein